MIIGDELRSWVTDHRKQRDAHQAIRRFEREWEADPARQAFFHAMAALPEPSPEAVADTVRTLFADHDWVDALVDRLADEMGRDPYFGPPLRSLNGDILNGLVLIEDENAWVTAGVCPVAKLAAKKNGKRGALSIVLTGQVSVLKFIKAGGATLSVWEAPEITEDFAAATAGQCRHVATRDIVDGEILVIDGRRQGFVIEHASANIVMLHAIVMRGRAPVTVEYDAASHDYVGCSAVDDNVSRLQMIATLARKLGGKGAFEAIAACLDHPNFFVRWHMMRELLGIDPAAALPHLKRMAARDPHADVRYAARSVLDRIEGPVPEREAA